jgi:peptidoglycan lytic transglycosylase G
MNKILRWGAMSLAVAALLLAGVIFVGAAKWRSPAAAVVEVPSGSTVRSISGSLATQQVIRMPKLFELWARGRGLSRSLKAGTYEFPAGMTMGEVLGKLARGEIKQYPFRVIEGWTIAEIAAALKDQPFLASPSVPEDFVRLVHDPAFMAQLGIASAPSLEGYLFPDTYLVARPLTAEALIKRMVAQFKEVWSGLVATGAPARSQAEIVTLASMVEKETGQPAERPLIAGVFMNRLKYNMPLASDPTIIYGLPNFDGNLRRSDLVNPHPYNTYVHGGLPPGPIGNPGKAALEAVLHPAQTDYLYFVARGDGTHQFSKTMAEHLLAVRKYQIEPKARP